MHKITRLSSLTDWSHRKVALTKYLSEYSSFAFFTEVTGTIDDNSFVKIWAYYEQINWVWTFILIYHSASCYNTIKNLISTKFYRPSYAKTVVLDKIQETFFFSNLWIWLGTLKKHMPRFLFSFNILVFIESSFFVIYNWWGNKLPLNIPFNFLNYKSISAYNSREQRNF